MRDPSHLVQRGEQYLEAGHLGEAEACARDALEMLPQDVEALVLLGRTLFFDDRVLDAQAPLKAALSEDPDSEEALSLLALCVAA